MHLAVRLLASRASRHTQLVALCNSSPRKVVQNPDWILLPFPPHLREATALTAVYQTQPPHQLLFSPPLHPPPLSPLQPLVPFAASQTCRCSATFVGAVPSAWNALPFPLFTPGQFSSSFSCKGLECGSPGLGATPPSRCCLYFPCIPYQGLQSSRVTGLFLCWWCGQGWIAGSAGSVSDPSLPAPPPLSVPSGARHE